LPASDIGRINLDSPSQIASGEVRSQAVQATQKSRLSAAGRTTNQRELAGFKLKVDSRKQWITFSELELEIGKFQHQKPTI
jgi:hypothetical protein